VSYVEGRGAAACDCAQDERTLLRKLV
jgi:hypothetical protein